MLPSAQAIAGLRSIQEIPAEYQQVFSRYHNFNVLQSSVFEDVFRTDRHIVVSAPTGSGKTVVFELAIVRLLQQVNKSNKGFKIVYVAPMKAMCEEKLVEWHLKFAGMGITYASVTGDSDYIDFGELKNYNVIVTTPEKWDVMTRKWKENKDFLESVRLFMIDEVHLLNDDIRGPTLEAVVSRMKMIQNCCGGDKVRFLAVSATIPNIEDVAEWLDSASSNMKYFQFSEDIRPVPLHKVVIGYPYNPQCSSPFKFDIMLSYKLQSILDEYSEGKPVLVFCNTRKSVEMTVKHIMLNMTIDLSANQRQVVTEAVKNVSDSKLRESLLHGVGCHHAGMLPENRRIIEDLFRKGHLPVLVSTSTLALGVNLPAHLVIIKTTKHYNYINREFQDYSEAAIQQMIGRAGRPSFDTSGVAVIMTTMADKVKFERMVGGTEPVESGLHRHLIEHLNSEVVLGTISDLHVAMEWLTSTFLYIRARKNPRHYGINVGLDKGQIDKKLLEMCNIEINKLARGGMLVFDETVSITPTHLGCLMAKYYLSFKTMDLLTQINGTEVLQQMLSFVSKCEEFSDLHLRVDDKKTLNILNKCRDRETVRFPLNGKIQTLGMKVNCLIQAVFGNLQITDHSLLNDSERIMRNGERIVNCLIDYLSSPSFQNDHPQSYNALLSAVTLVKCFRARLWENTQYAVKQLPGVGIVMSTALATAGKKTFQDILEANPRDIERIMNRKPPFGNQIQELIQHIPKYAVSFTEVDRNDTQNSTVLELKISLVNCETLKQKSTVDLDSLMALIIGDNLNNILVYEKYSHSYMMTNSIEKSFSVQRQQQSEVTVNFISMDWVGIDYETKITFKDDDNKEQETVPFIPKQKHRARQAFTKKTIKKTAVKGKTGGHIQSFLERYMKTTKKPTILQKKVSFVRRNSKTLNKKDASKKADNSFTAFLEDRCSTGDQEKSENHNDDVELSESFDMKDDLVNVEKTAKENWTLLPVASTSGSKQSGQSAAAKAIEKQTDYDSFSASRPLILLNRVTEPKTRESAESNNPLYPDSTCEDLIVSEEKTTFTEDNRRKSTKSLTWRNPLVISPVIRFSPKVRVHEENANSEPSTNNKPGESPFLERCVPRPIVPAKPPSKPSNSEQPKTSTKHPSKPTPKKTRFLLADCDYEDENQAKSDGDRKTILSDSLLSLLTVEPNTKQMSKYGLSQLCNKRQTVDDFPHFLSQFKKLKPAVNEIEAAQRQTTQKNKWDEVPPKGSDDFSLSSGGKTKGTRSGFPHIIGGVSQGKENVRPCSSTTKDFLFNHKVAEQQKAFPLQEVRSNYSRGPLKKTSPPSNPPSFSPEGAESIFSDPNGFGSNLHKQKNVPSQQENLFPFNFPSVAETRENTYLFPPGDGFKDAAENVGNVSPTQSYSPSLLSFQAPEEQRQPFSLMPGQRRPTSSVTQPSYGFPEREGQNFQLIDERAGQAFCPVPYAYDRPSTSAFSQRPYYHHSLWSRPNIYARPSSSYLPYEGGVPLPMAPQAVYAPPAPSPNYYPDHCCYHPGRCHPPPYYDGSATHGSDASFCRREEELRRYREAKRAEQESKQYMLQRFFREDSDTT